MTRCALLLLKIEDQEARKLTLSQNPKFTYQPFTGMAVSQAAFTFIYRFMANHSAEAPEGILSRDVLKSFMSISGPDANPKWTFGHERIPKNWYRRNQADAYSVGPDEVLPSERPLLTQIGRSPTLRPTSSTSPKSSPASTSWAATKAALTATTPSTPRRCRTVPTLPIRQRRARCASRLSFSRPSCRA